MHCSPRDVMPGFDVSKGGSLILCNARIASGNELDWEPGEPIQRPQNPVVDVRGLCGVHCAVGWHVAPCAMLNPYVVPTLALSPWQVELPHSASKATVSRPGLQLRYGCVLASPCGAGVRE